MTGRSEDIRNFILKGVREHPQDIARVTSEQFGITRQAVGYHLMALVQEGSLNASGRTRARQYELALLAEHRYDFPLTDALKEDLVWRAHVKPHLQDLPKNVSDICDHGLTEMLNNALDHSGGKKVILLIRRTAIDTELLVIDDGVGIFHKIAQAKGLAEEQHAVLELAKGKLTTDPQRHSGEGVFFTSRMFDRYTIVSGELVFGHHDAEMDWVMDRQSDHLDGTCVRMEIASDSSRTVQEVFDQFADESGLIKTHVPVRLLELREESLISRSQAKRLLSRFESFRELLLDFRGVEMIGQAFSDEIFRVFVRQHPEIRLRRTNTGEQVEAMIRHVSGRGPSG